MKNLSVFPHKNVDKKEFCGKSGEFVFKEPLFSILLT